MSGHWPNRRWATIPYPPSASVWPVVMEEDATCRKSLDETLVLVKWEGVMPEILSGSTVYDHADILAILDGPVWTVPEPPPPPEEP